MTVSAEYNPIQYVGSGIIAPMPISWPYGEDDDVVVMEIDSSTLAESLRSRGIHYSLTKTDSGGVVTPLSAVAVGKSWRISRNTAIRQPDTLRLGGSFSEEAVEGMIDRQTRIIQEMDAKLVSGDELLRGELASPLPGKGAWLVKVKQAGPDAALRAAGEKLNEIVVSVFDWITDDTIRANVIAGTNTSDLLPYYQLAIAYLETASDGRGGVLKFPRGTHKLNGPLDFTCNATLLHSIEVRGDGPMNTVLDFSGASAGTDGVTFGHGAHFAIKNITIANAKRHGVVVGRGTTVGGSTYASMFELDNVRVQGCTTDGFYVQNSYLGVIKRCWGKANGRYGISLAGFHTALTVQACEASENVSSGWSINGVTYSNFEACGSDNNGTQGWVCTNLQGVTFTSCGAEGNQRDGWLFSTSNASATGLNTQSSNIRGVEMIGCYALSNSKAAAGTYATFVNMSTADSRSASLSVRGGVAHPYAAGDRAFILAGTSGAITLRQDGFDAAAFLTADSKSGTVEVVNAAVAGRRCMLQSSGNQSLSTGVEATVNIWNTTPVENSLGATVSSSSITIPRGVNRVRVSAGLGFEATSGGTYRLCKLFKNNAGFAGMGQYQAPYALYNLNNIESAVISVVEGDTFQVRMAHDAGVSVNTLGGPSNGFWFCVEAIG